MTQEEATAIVTQCKEEVEAILKKYEVAIVPTFIISGETMKSYYRYEKLIKQE